MPVESEVRFLLQVVDDTNFRVVATEKDSEQWTQRLSGGTKYIWNDGIRDEALSTSGTTELGMNGYVLRLLQCLVSLLCRKRSNTGTILGKAWQKGHLSQHIEGGSHLPVQQDCYHVCPE